MSDTAIYSFPAAIATRATNAELLTLAKSKGAVDPTIFDEVTPYFWGAEISSNRVDSYYTIMQPSTLKNYARALNDGVSFQNSHNTRELGLGYSLRGTYTGAQGNGLSRVVGDFYTIPGVKLGAVSTDDFIRGVRAGLIRDVSVGFRGGEYTCSICGRDMMKDWKCNHFPGLSYETHDTTGKNPKIINQQCTAAIENAELGEVSAVFDGATPSAMIQRANEAAVEGRLTGRQFELIEQRYRINLPTKRVQVPGATVLTTGTTSISIGSSTTASTANTTIRVTPEDEPFVTDVASDEEPTEDNAVIEQGDSTWSEINEPAKLDEPIASSTNTTDDNIAESVPDSTGDRAAELVAENNQPEGNINNMAEIINTDRIAALETERTGLQDQLRVATADIERLKPFETEVTTLRARVLELEPLANDGTAYRENLIKETIAEGVRAFGADFAVDTYTALLKGVPLDTVKRMNTDWKKAADTIFSGGRKTVDGVDGVSKDAPATESDDKSNKNVANAAYAG